MVLPALIFGLLLCAQTAEAGSCHLVNNTVIGSKASTYTKASGASAAVCCSTCQAESKCVSFTFEPSKKTCFFKSDSVVVEERAGAVSGFSGNVPPSPAPPPASTLTIKIGGVVNEIDPGFKCWNIDPSQNREWETRDMTSPKLRYLAKESLPGYLRFGGSGADGFDYWCKNGTDLGASAGKQAHHCLNETWFDNFMGFARDSTAKLVFGLDINPRKGKDWDPSKAKLLIKYAISHGYEFYGFELGNEQNAKFSAEAEAQDFKILSDLLVELYPDAAKRPKIIGPDAHGFHTGPPSSAYEQKVKFLGDFAKACEQQGVPLHAITHHEYIEVDEYATVPPPASKLDLTKTIAAAVNASLSKYGVQIWAGEIGPHNGKSPPCSHSSMRWANFADTFWYIDSMATKAANGYSVFCRQDFVGIDYGMLDCATNDPLPDYYGGILWSKLMGTKVLNVQIEENQPQLRAYAHCTAGKSDSITILLMNLGNGPLEVKLAFPGKTPADLERILYELTGPNGTNAPIVGLNGQTLRLDESGKLPSMAGLKVTKGNTIRMAPESISFVQIASVHPSGCAGYLKVLV